MASRLRPTSIWHRIPVYSFQRNPTFLGTWLRQWRKIAFREPMTFVREVAQRLKRILGVAATVDQWEVDRTRTVWTATEVPICAHASTTSALFSATVASRRHFPWKLFIFQRHTLLSIYKLGFSFFYEKASSPTQVTVIHHSEINDSTHQWHLFARHRAPDSARRNLFVIYGHCWRWSKDSDTPAPIPTNWNVVKAEHTNSRIRLLIWVAPRPMSAFAEHAISQLLRK